MAAFQKQFAEATKNPVPRPVIVGDGKPEVRVEIKEVQVVKEVPVVKEVRVEVIKEVIKEVPVYLPAKEPEAKPVAEVANDKKEGDEKKPEDKQPEEEKKVPKLETQKSRTETTRKRIKDTPSNPNSPKKNPSPKPKPEEAKKEEPKDDSPKSAPIEKLKSGEKRKPVASTEASPANSVRFSLLYCAVIGTYLGPSPRNHTRAPASVARKLCRPCRLRAKRTRRGVLATVASLSRSSSRLNAATCAI